MQKKSFWNVLMCWQISRETHTYNHTNGMLRSESTTSTAISELALV